MSVTVDAFGCPNFQAFPQTWTDRQQSLLKPWNGETMWLHPPEHLCSHVAVKMVMEACRGVAIISVVKEASWWCLVVKRYPSPMAHGPEACEPSHLCGGCRHRLSAGYPCSPIREIWNPISNH